MKRIRYAQVTLRVKIPVYSHTAEEAQAIAKDVLPDFLEGFEEADWERARDGAVALYDHKPSNMSPDAVVWGDGVPEEHDTVAKLTAHLAEK